MNEPNLRFNEFKDEWKKVNLYNLSKVYDGTHQTPIYTTYGVPFVSAENIDNLYNTNKYISKDDFEKIYKNSKPKNQDLLMTRIGKIGKVNKVTSNSPLAYYVTLALIKIKKEIDSNYLMYNIQSEKVQKELWAKTLHIAFPPKINKNEISKINVFITNYNEQQKIGHFFETLDQLIQLQSDKLEHLKVTKKGYLQKMFPNKNNPSLEFSEFNNNWITKSLSSLVSIRTGNKNVEDNIKDGNYVFFDRSSDIKHLNDYDFEGEVIVYAGEGAKFLPRLYNGKYSLHQRAYGLYDFKSINVMFLYQFLLTQNNNFIRYSVGTTAKSLRMDNFNRISVPITLIQEQQKIGQFFSNLDQQIILQQQKLDKLKQQKKAYLQKMFI